MPEITRFDGMVIQMFYQDHPPPHFHVVYGSVKACFDIKEGVFSKGALPNRQSRLILAWNELYRDELLDMWEKEEIRKLPPLC